MHGAEAASFSSRKSPPTPLIAPKVLIGSGSDESREELRLETEGERREGTLLISLSLGTHRLPPLGPLKTVKL